MEKGSSDVQAKKARRCSNTTAEHCGAGKMKVAI